MKKFKTTCLFMVFALFAIICACDKSEKVTFSDLNINNQKQNEATWIHRNDGSKGLPISLKFVIGHTANQCGNACMMIFGQLVHVDCRGFGNICNHTVSAEVFDDLVNNELTLKIIGDDIFGEFEIFPFPDRCFYITNPQNNLELWLNIPEQVLLKDSSGTEIVIYDAWFYEEPELEND